MKLDNLTSQIYVVALNEARLHGHEYLTPEHFLYCALLFDEGKEMVKVSGGHIDTITQELNNFFQERLPRQMATTPMESYSFNQMLNLATLNARNAGKAQLSVVDFVLAIFTLKESFAKYILAKNGVNKQALIQKPQIRRQPRSAAAQEQKNPLLASYTVDLVEAAKAKKLDPLVGREDILERTAHVLCRRLKNNPVHVGDPGVGKTAIVEGLAQRISSGQVPAPLKNVQLLRIDMAALVAGTRYRGDFEERMVKLLEAIAALKKPIIYIDEIHTVVGTGAVSGGSMDATSIIKPYLSKGEIRFIGSTTHKEYKKHFEKDRALARRFARIDIAEPSTDECFSILQGLRPHYEKFHGVKYSDEILRQIVTLSSRHMNDRCLPDKAIDTMDEAGVLTRLGYVKTTAPHFSTGKKSLPVENRSFANEKAASKPYPVTESAVEKIIARNAKVPENSVTADESSALKTLAKDLHSRIFGQEEAVEAVTHAIHSSRAGLNEPEHPVASLLFLGPTGVGKTEMARQLAELLGIQLSRFDMSEYQEKHAVARLIGSPPGYVGYEEGGLLTEAIRRNPHCVLLLDEIEKAHSDILNVLLQVMDHGTLTDNTGKKADFRNVIIIMTSNAGAREMTRQTIGFDAAKDLAAADKALERIFSPEFRNRLDTSIRFKAVDKAMALKIAKKALDKLGKKLSAKDVKFSTTKAALEHIAEKGLSETYGAREIIRLVENDVKKLLVHEVLFGALSKGGVCKLTLTKTGLEVNVKSKELRKELQKADKV